MHGNTDVLGQILDEVLQSEGLVGEFTNSELQYLNLVSSVLDAAQKLSTNPSEGHHQLSAKGTGIDSWLQRRSDSALDADGTHGMHDLTIKAQRKHLKWEFLHEAFMTLEGLQLITAFLHFNNSLGGKVDKKKKAVLTELRERILAAHQHLRADVARRKNALSESGVIGELVDGLLERNEQHQDLIGRGIEGLVDKDWLENFASSVINSWEEALDGVLRVNID